MTIALKAARYATAVSVVGLLTACSGSDEGVTVNVILESESYFEGDHRGRQVTGSATVTEVPGPRSSELDGARPRRRQPARADARSGGRRGGSGPAGVGHRGQLHRMSENDYAPGSYDLHEADDTEPYLYQAAVEPPAGHKP